MALSRRQLLQRAGMAGVFMALASNPVLAEFLSPLIAKLEEWETLSRKIAGDAMRDPDEIGGAAYDYMFFSGYVALAYWWTRSVAAAEASSRPQAFKDAKRETARFYFARLLPRTLAHKAAIESGVGNLTALDEAAFD